MSSAESASDPPKKQHGPFYAFTFPNFRLFFFGQMVSVIGSWMQMVAQNWVVWEITHDKLWIGIVNGAAAIPFAICAIPAGALADRFSRRVILLWTQVAAMILAFALALLAFGVGGIKMQAWHIAVLSAFSGIVNAVNMPAQQSLVSELVEDRAALGNAIALSGLRFNLARFIGPFFAGIALVHFGAAICFLLNGFSFIATIISLWFLRLKPTPPRLRNMNVLEGLGYVWKTRTTLRIFLLLATNSVFCWSASTLYPVLATHFGQGEKGYSAMVTWNGLGATIGALTMATFGNQLRRRNALYVSALVFAALILLTSVVPSFTLLLVVLAFSGYTMILFAMSANTGVQEAVPDNLRGRVMALYSLVFQGLFAVGGVLIGALAEYKSTQSAILINGGIALTLSTVITAWAYYTRWKSAKLVGSEP